VVPLVSWRHLPLHDVLSQHPLCVFTTETDKFSGHLGRGLGNQILDLQDDLVRNRLLKHQDTTMVNTARWIRALVPLPLRCIRLRRMFAHARPARAPSSLGLSLNRHQPAIVSRVKPHMPGSDERLEVIIV